VSNAVAVVRGISGYEGDADIKACLIELFNWELSNSSVRAPQFRNPYVKIINQHASNWVDKAEASAS